MIGRIPKVAVVVLTVLCASSRLEAQSTRLLLGGGVGIPVGVYDDVVKLGWHGTAGVSFQPRGLPVGLQIDGTYAQFSDESPLDIKNQLIYGTADARLRFSSSPGSQPYIIGGVGVYNSKATGSDALEDSSTDFGINLGAGFDFGTAFFLEARWHNVFLDGDNLKFIPLTLGVRLGG
jgi:opacity protein-like surface antigen